MKGSSSPPKSKKPYFSYSEALFDAALVLGGTLLLGWLNVPYSVQLLIIPASIILVVGAKLFYSRRRT